MKIVCFAAVCPLYEHTIQLCKDNALLAAVSWFPLKTHFNYEGEKEGKKRTSRYCSSCVLREHTIELCEEQRTSSRCSGCVLCEYTV